MIILFTILLNMVYCQISEGYTLFSPIPDQGSSNDYTTYLIDNSENIINTWTHPCKPVTISYLLSDSSLVIPCTQDEVNGLGGEGQSSFAVQLRDMPRRSGMVERRIVATS